MFTPNRWNNNLTDIRYKERKRENANHLNEGFLATGRLIFRGPSDPFVTPVLPDPNEKIDGFVEDEVGGPANVDAAPAIFCSGTPANVVVVVAIEDELLPGSAIPETVLLAGESLALVRIPVGVTLLASDSSTSE